MYKIHCLNNISEKGTGLLTDAYQLTDDMSEATGVLVRSAAMHDMEFPESLLAIGRAGAGVNNIPLDRCADEGIVVFNSPGANANAVKELVVCGMLLASRGVIGGIDWCKENADDENIGKSAEKAKKAFAGGEIMGKKLGVIGLGAIGRLVAEAGEALGMEIMGYDPFAPADNPYRTTEDLNDIYRNCDYITVHVPAMESTKGMINAEACALMNGAVVLNFSRDTLVDAEGIAGALEAGQVRCYVTDFATPAVMKMPNTIVMPHLGASTAEAEENCAIMATNELMDFIERGIIDKSVNFPAINAGELAEGSARIVVLHTAAAADAVAAAAGTVAATATRGERAVTIADVAAADAEAAAAALAAVEGVARARVLA